MRLPRAHDLLLQRHLGSLRQMAFVSGARQVGKTTVCRDLAAPGAYLNWDNEDHRAVILAGPRAVADMTRLFRLAEEPVVVVFDELHKYRRWKAFLKGFFDTYADRARLVVTGSSRLDVYRRGGDSLMGRYFAFRLHPLSAGEILDPRPAEGAPRSPRPLAEEEWDALWTFGGYPEPFVRRDIRFLKRWLRLRTDQFVREDVRDLTAIHEIDQLAILVRILATRSGSQLNYSSLARDVRVSVDTVRRWIGALVSLFHGFLVRPWFRNVTRSLRKEPKWYLRDWAAVEDPGPRAETFVACHLLKAVESWEDAGLGTFELRYLRDKEGREVDFVVVRDDQPWFLVEVKRTDESVSPALRRFQAQTGAPHAFQVVLDLPYVAADPFERSDPCVVPARTLLPQLP